MNAVSLINRLLCLLIRIKRIETTDFYPPKWGRSWSKHIALGVVQFLSDSGGKCQRFIV